MGWNNETEEGGEIRLVGRKIGGKKGIDDEG